MYATTPVADLFPATVGERVTAARARAGLTLAQAIGDEGVLDVATLAGIEDGSVERVSMAHLLWLSWQFDCPLADLTGSEVRDRAILSHHGAPDMAVVQRLVVFLELGAYLEQMGVPRPAPARG